ncbi:MAG: sugar phosphate isomerase/epimerase family protein [bacterium]
MRHNIGLKLWSTNTGTYFKEAQRLYEQGVYDYLELYIVPNTLETLPQWQQLEIPYIIHNPHSAQGFNLADKDKRENNRRIYDQSKQFADALNAEYIIFHGGKDGNIEETVMQLSAFHEPHALIENLPVYPLPNSPFKRCRGATFEELRFIKNETNCGFCLDFGHAICSANTQGKEPLAFLKELMTLEPKMYHLSDLTDVHSFYDSHAHLGTGTLDISTLKREILPAGAKVSIETEKSLPQSLQDFADDVAYFRKL